MALKQSLGTAPLAQPADLSSQVSMDAPDPEAALPEDHIWATSQWSQTPFDELPHEAKMIMFKRDGYFCFGKSNEQILEKDDERRLQPPIQKVADRYISSTGKRVDNGPNYRLKSSQGRAFKRWSV